MGLTKRVYTDLETVITAENLNEIQDAIIALEDGLFSVDSDKSGVAITVTDAAIRGLRRLNIYGKTTQDGTPTPDAPIDLVSPAVRGNITVHSCGKNLFTGWIVGGIYPTDGSDYAVATQRRTPYIPISSPGQKYRISNITATLYSMVAFYDADKQFISRSAAAPRNWMLVEPPKNAKYFRLTVYENLEVDGKIADADAMASSTMIEAGEVVTDYEQGKKIQAADISAPNGLHGIPVSSGENYTDANGQKWLCDEIDLARGVYIQRVGTIVFDGSSDEGWIFFTTVGHQFHIPVSNCFHSTSVSSVYSTHFVPDIIGSRADTYDICYSYSAGVAINTMVATSVTEWREWLAKNPITMLYRLISPVETPLTEKSLAAFAALETYKEYATISNDGHAYMELEYVMDAKKYIDSLIAGGSSAGIVDATVE